MPASENYFSFHNQQTFAFFFFFFFVHQCNLIFVGLFLKLCKFLSSTYPQTNQRITLSDIWRTFSWLAKQITTRFAILGLSPLSSLLSFHHLHHAINIHNPWIQNHWFLQALLQNPIRLAELSLDQYGVSVSPEPIMRKTRLNLKLSMTGRISVQPKTSLT